jgi:hypothetical protein
METPGQRFKRELRQDVERSLKGARMQVSFLLHQLKTYQHTEFEFNFINNELNFWKRETELFKKELDQMEGASYNETPQFKEVSCITV